MSGTFKWQFGAWLINLQDATRFEELELHNLEFCQPENCPLRAWETGKTPHSAEVPWSRKQFGFFMCLYLSLCPTWSLQLQLSVFSPSQNWLLTQQPVFLESQCANCLGKSLSWEILETCSWSGFRQALGITAGHIWAWRPKEFRSINRKFGARGKTQDLTQYCITEGYDGNTTSACCLYLPQKHPGLGILD